MALLLLRADPVPWLGVLRVRYVDREHGDEWLGREIRHDVGVRR